MAWFTAVVCIPDLHWLILRCRYICIYCAALFGSIFVTHSLQTNVLLLVFVGVCMLLLQRGCLVPVGCFLFDSVLQLNVNNNHLNVADRCS